MEEFLSKFFPEVDKQMHEARRETAYCKFDNQLLQLFTSSLYLAALASSFVASAVTRKYGRKISMFVGGVAFLIGSLFNAFATNVAMLIVGRLLLGVGVGFANQVSQQLNMVMVCLLCGLAQDILVLDSVWFKNFSIFQSGSNFQTRINLHLRFSFKIQINN